MNDLDLELLRDMLSHAEVVTRLLGSSDATYLVRDERSYLAIRHALQVVGEAASRISEQGRASLPDIPWSQVIGMRHHLVHGYRQVRAEIIVRTIREDLPGLIGLLRQALESQG
jgi:uncharacterized protein with HEPN domain